MKIEKIGIVGQGFVGTAVREGLQNYFTVLTHDKNGKCSNTLEEVVNESDFIFVSVPTPSNKDGSISLDIVYDIFDKMNNVNNN